MDDQARAQSLLDRYDDLGVFTERQAQILRAIAAGRSHHDIAAEMGITVGTLRGQRQKAQLNARVFDAHNRPRRSSGRPTDRTAEARAWIARDAELAGLTPRLAEIVRLCAEGLTAEEIGSRLGVTPETIVVHFNRARDRIAGRE